MVGGVDLLLIDVAVHNPQQAYFAALCAVAGSVGGSLILFAIARKGGEVLLTKHISTRRGKRLHAWFERYGLVTVFIPALSPLPMPMKVPVFCAGALEVRWMHFIAVVLAARFIRYFVLAYLGLHYGHQTFRFLASHVMVVTGIAVGLAILAVAVLRLAGRRDAAQSSSAMMSK